MVKVIVNKDDKVLGEWGKIINVSDGYARNYLIPRSLAVLATKSNIKHFEDIKRAQSKKIAKQTQAEEELKQKIEKSDLAVKVKAGANKKLFGSITNDMIAHALKDQLSVDVDRRRIIIPEPIKQLGKFPVHVKLKYNIVAQPKLNVLPEESEAQKEEEAEKKSEAAE